MTAVNGDTHLPVIDFDHHSEAYAANWEQIVRDLHALDFPLAWSQAHGGFWVTGSWTHIHEAAQDWETYAADNDVKGERRGGKGSEERRVGKECRSRWSPYH